MGYAYQLLQLTTISVLLALAVYLPTAAGSLVLCFGMVMGSGAIAGAAAMAHWNIPFGYGLIIGALTGAFIAALVGILLYRLRGFSFALATIAISEIARIIVLNTKNLGGALGYRNIDIRPFDLWPAVLLISFLFIFAIVDRSPFRRALSTIQQSEVLASTLGIDYARHRIISMFMGGILAGTAGVMYLSTVGILEPKIFSFEYGLTILAYVIVGGARRFWGAAAGAAFLSIVPELLRFSSSARMLLYGASITIIVVLWPEGFTRKQINILSALFIPKKR